MDIQYFWVQPRHTDQRLLGFISTSVKMRLLRSIKHLDIFGSHQKYLVDTSGPVKFYLIPLGKSGKLRMDPPYTKCSSDPPVPSSCYVELFPLAIPALHLHTRSVFLHQRCEGGIAIT